MTQTQMLLMIFVPTFTVLVGILLNRNDYSKLDGRVSAMENRLESRISGVDGRLGSIEARLDGRISALEATFHSDMLLVIGKLTELDVRVAKLEGQRQ